MSKKKRDRSEESRRYREAHKEEIHARGKLYYQKNKERILKNQAAYREKEKAEMTEEDLELRRAYRRALYQVKRENEGKTYTPRIGNI